MHVGQGSTNLHNGNNIPAGNCVEVPSRGDRIDGGRIVLRSNQNQSYAIFFPVDYLKHFQKSILAATKQQVLLVIDHQASPRGALLLLHLLPHRQIVHHQVSIDVARNRHEQSRAKDSNPIPPIQVLKEVHVFFAVIPQQLALHPTAPNFVLLEGAEYVVVEDGEPALFVAEEGEVRAVVDTEEQFYLFVVF